MSKLDLLLRGLLICSFFCFASTSLWATHNRAGEIEVERVAECGATGQEALTLRITVTTYTRASSTQADRDTVTVCFGYSQDGVEVCERVARVNGPGNPPQGELLENDTKVNFYIVEHTFPSRGTYIISMTDPNRNAGILNVNAPNSVLVPFHIQTQYTFTNPQSSGCNTSPNLTVPPVDIGCVGQIFTHNPNAVDLEKDSLSYEFVTPMQSVDADVPNYEEVTMIGPGGLGNQISINEETGEIIWDAPQVAGEYNIAIKVTEWRSGQPIGYVIRDMQILIEECENLPPIVEVPFEEICVIAGEIVEFDVRATAPLIDTDQKVRLIAQGGPFATAFNQPTFEPAGNNFLEDPVVKTFRWQTACEDISSQFVQVVFKATDDFFGESGLATLKTVRIKVVGPPPQDVQAEPTSEDITVSWELPYACEDTEIDYFRGFSVWRREGSTTVPIDTCTPGLDGSGYQQISPNYIQEEQDGRYIYVDTDVERGRTYCYRVLGQFAFTSTTGTTTFNAVESLASDSACVQLSRDVPLITNVSVQQTDVNNGEMEVCWSKPLAEDLDTVLNAGPYVYEVLRAPGLNPSDAEFAPIGVSFSSPTYAGANDTCFVDTGLNTSAEAYSYKINFYVNGESEPLGATNGASSVFLSIAPTDNTNVLSWEETVPWNNSEYIVFRQNESGTFDSLTTVTEPTYRDEGLINGEEYCYFIRSIGSYGVVGIRNPLINDSQENCSVPIDNVPPCPPELAVFTACDQEDIDCSDEEELFNTLDWTNPMDICEETDDVVGYRIYYAPFEGDDFTLIEEIDNSSVTNYEHNPDIGIAGCYAVTAIDTFFNESEFSNIVCVDNCPNYSLPNAFTPNGDGQNEVFRPFPYCFIDRVEFTVFNRWGQVVYTTTDPDINWDGRNLQGQPLKEGTYYYTCRYFERRVAGITLAPNVLKGYIELIRGAR